MVSSEDLAAGISDQDSDMVSLARRIVYLRPQAATINFFPVPLRTTPPSPFQFPSPPSSPSSSSSMARGPSRGVASPALAYPWPTWGISNYYFTDLVTIYIAFSHLLLSPPPPKSWKEVTPAEPPFRCRLCWHSAVWRSRRRPHRANKINSRSREDIIVFCRILNAPLGVMKYIYMGMLQGSLFTAIALFASPFQKTSVYTYYIVITTGFPGASGAEGSIQHPMRTGGLLRGQLQRWRIYRRADDPVGGGAGAGPDRGHPGGIGRAKADGGLRRQGAAGGA